MDNIFDRVQEAKQFIIQQNGYTCKQAIVLGTGLGNLAEQIVVEHSIPYAVIPHFPTSTVESHLGKLLFGKLDGVPVIVLAGRFHYYEGYSMRALTFPIRVLKSLDVEVIYMSNVSGSVNPNFQPGSLVLVRDHINTHPENPLRGINDERLGPRFPDMLQTYDKALRDSAIKIAKQSDIQLYEGVYLSLQGPNLETPAEYHYYHTIGADLIGMSTVPEVIVARHAGIRICVISVVSNLCYPISAITETTIDEVIAIANLAEPKLTTLIRGLVTAQHD
mgnify:CR=1 FL=1